MEETVKIVLEAVQRAQAEIERSIKALDRLNATNKQSETLWARANKAIELNDATLRKLTIGATAAAAAVVLLARASINNAAATKRQAEDAGTTSEKLSELAFSAKLANIEQVELAQSLAFLNKALVDAQDETSSAAKLFAELGVATTAGGKIRDAVDVTLDLAQAYKTSEGAAVKATFARELFGRGGQRFVSFLNQGSVALREQAAEAAKLSAVIGTDLAKNAQEFNDNMDKLQAAIKGGANVLVKELLPGMIHLQQTLLQNAGAVRELGSGLAGTVGIIATAGQFWTTWATAAGLAIAVPVVAALGPIAVAIAAITTVLTAGALAWKAWAAERNAAINEKDAQRQLAQTNVELRRRVEIQIDEAVKAGKITEEGAQRMSSALKKNIENADGFTRALEDVLKTLRQINDLPPIGGAAPGDANFIGPLPASTPSKTLTAPKTDAQLAAGRSVTATNAGANNDELDALSKIAEAKAKELELNGLLNQSDLERAAQVSAQQTAAALATASQVALEEEAFRVKREQLLLDLTASKATADEKATALEGIETAHQAKLASIRQQGAVNSLEIAKREELAQKALREQRLQATATMFGNIAITAEAFGKKGVAIAKAAATAQAVINTYSSAVAAFNAMAGIPYVGPVLGAIAAAAAIAAGLANIAKINGVTFAEGGLVPGAPSRTDNRVATVATGEYIFDSSSVQAMGPAWFAALHQSIRAGSFGGMAFASGGLVPKANRGSSFAGGGLVGQAVGTQTTQGQTSLEASFAFINSRQEWRRFQKREGVKIVADAMGRRSNSFAT